ncbi:hypothetical protein [Streptosporangium sp. NBC_01469]|uniref:hypothetical protein n=1 Tax=Streptosporangium sp. NBC_01469 TaxID=2903898 RepID=UPI002E2CF175|nr:hypothetical protein [Streptosporangium sp. NBC_01469]
MSDAWGTVWVPGAPVRGELVRLRSGYRLRLEVAYEAEFIGGTLKIDDFEILEAGWFAPDDLPGEPQESHRLLIQRKHI